jgi:hypothetical protein
LEAIVTILLVATSSQCAFCSCKEINRTIAQTFDDSRGISTVALKSAGSGGRGESREFDAGATFLGFYIAVKIK